MDLVDEQDVLRLQVGKDCRLVAGAGYHGTGGGAEAHAEFLGDDLRQRRLAQSRRPMEQHVIQCLFAFPRGGDEHGEIFAHRLLTDEIA